MLIYLEKSYINDAAANGVKNVIEEIGKKAKITSIAIDSITNQILSAIQGYLLPRVVLEDACNLLYKSLDKRLPPGLAGLDMDSHNNMKEFAEFDQWLNNHIEYRVTAFADNLLNALKRFIDHQAEIENYLGELDRIDDIIVHDGETHNEGKQLAIFKFPGDCRLVYKPVNPGGLKMVHDILSITCESSLLYAPKCYASGEDYMFLEYIERGEDRLQDNDVESFYVGLGVALSISYAFCITDLHHENIVAQKGRPVLLDLETVCYQTPREVEPFSVYHTGMIGDSRSSAMQAGGSKSVWRPIVIQGDGRRLPAIQYRQKEWKDQNRVYNKSGMAQPNSYLTSIEEGFRLGYARILQSRSAVYDAIQSRVMSEEVRVRHLIRFTAYYNNMLAWLVQPVSDLNKRQKELFNRLYVDDNAAEPLSSSIVDVEESDLLAGDVPYFWSNASSRNLLHSSGIIVYDYFHEPAMKRTHKHLYRLSEADCAGQIELIRRTLANDA